MLGRVVLAALTLSACRAPLIVLEIEDASSDAAFGDVAIDTRPTCRTFRLDGGVCAGHDDDGDCVPDSCDSCPAVVDAPATGTVLSSGIGAIPETAVCAHAFAPFDTVRTRLFFEPFEDASHALAVHSNTATTGLHRGISEITLGGAAIDGTGSPWLTFPSIDVPPGRPAIVIAIMRVESGAGILMRTVDGSKFDTYYAYGCYLSVVTRRFGAFKAAPPCGVGGCSSTTDLKTPWPDRVPDTGRVGVRMSFADTDGGALVECELFDPEKPESLLLARTSDSVSRTTFPPPVYPSGRIGLFTESAPTVFESIDVQFAP
ncbi:MAG: hypothetical protein ACXWUG_24475 [Polyangiales bacterium]